MEGEEGQQQGHGCGEFGSKTEEKNLIGGEVGGMDGQTDSEIVLQQWRHQSAFRS